MDNNETRIIFLVVFRWFLRFVTQMYGTQCNGFRDMVKVCQDILYPFGIQSLSSTKLQSTFKYSLTSLSFHICSQVSIKAKNWFSLNFLVIYSPIMELDHKIYQKKNIMKENTLKDNIVLDSSIY